MNIIKDYFPNITEKQVNQILHLKKLYIYWNNKINVISRKSIENIYTHHILHSLAIEKIIKFKSNTNIIDVGTGGGFPGIPLAILNPDVNFILLDSITKKIKVVNEIANGIGLTNIRTINNRVENINETFDFVISRAVTNMTKFTKLVGGKFNKLNNNDLENGILYLKGGDLTSELKGISYKEYNISKYFSEDFFRTKKIIYIKGLTIPFHKNK
tara:strand:+ start:2075 stop:2716 length:642 start_codon:yes stop_codon:yes gene_type:complete